MQIGTATCLERDRIVLLLGADELVTWRLQLTAMPARRSRHTTTSPKDKRMQQHATSDRAYKSYPTNARWHKAQNAHPATGCCVCLRAQNPARHRPAPLKAAAHVNESSLSGPQVCDTPVSAGCTRAKDELLRWRLGLQAGNGCRAQPCVAIAQPESTGGVNDADDIAWRDGLGVLRHELDNLAGRVRLDLVHKLHRLRSWPPRCSPAMCAHTRPWRQS